MSQQQSQITKFFALKPVIKKNPQQPQGQQQQQQQQNQSNQKQQSSNVKTPVKTQQNQQQNKPQQQQNQQREQNIQKRKSETNDNTLKSKNRMSGSSGNNAIEIEEDDFKVNEGEQITSNAQPKKRLKKIKDSENSEDQQQSSQPSIQKQQQQQKQQFATPKDKPQTPKNINKNEEKIFDSEDNDFGEFKLTDEELKYNLEQLDRFKFVDDSKKQKQSDKQIKNFFKNTLNQQPSNSQQKTSPSQPPKQYVQPQDYLQNQLQKKPTTPNKQQQQNTFRGSNNQLNVPAPNNQRLVSPAKTEELDDLPHKDEMRNEEDSIDFELIEKLNNTSLNYLNKNNKSTNQQQNQQNQQRNQQTQRPQYQQQQQFQQRQGQQGSKFTLQSNQKNVQKSPNKIAQPQQQQHQQKNQTSNQKPQQKKQSSSKANNSSSKVQPTEQQPLAGKVFCLTGVLQNIDREKLSDLIKTLGGKVNSQISGKVNYLVYGELLEDGRQSNTSKKYRDAEAKNIAKYNEAEFEELFEKLTKKTIQDAQEAINQYGSIVGGDTSNNNPQNQMQIESQKNNTQQQSDSGQKKVLKVVGGFSAYQNKQKQAPGSSVIQQPKVNDTQLWTHKYAPTKSLEIIGNQAVIENFRKWLRDWEDVVIRGNKKPTNFVPGRQWSQATNPNAKGCLISGPPGVGKTTAVRIVAKELGYQVIEKNASDMRNKNSIQEMLLPIKNNTQINFFQQKNKMQDENQQSQLNQKFIVLMDEVDGMSGSDRGGNAALIQVIKDTRFPIVCIANDRQKQSVKSLANSCYDLKFQKPTKNSIAKRMVEIARAEGFQIDVQSVELLCEQLGNDLRQILNMMQMFKRKEKTLNYQQVKSKLQTTKKDDVVMLNVWDAVTKLLQRHEFSKLSFRELVDLFFYDYDLVPLLIQQNYLDSVNKQQFDLKKIALAADQISQGDIMSRFIHQNQDYGLLPQLAFSSAIYPTQLASQTIGFPTFPVWFGKNSTQNKIRRELTELESSIRHHITGNKFSVKFDYSPALLALLEHAFQNQTTEDVITILDNYSLNPIQMKENLVEVQFNPRKLEYFSGVSAAQKAALTKAYNKRHDVEKGKKQKRGKDEEYAEHQRFNEVIDDEFDNLKIDENELQDDNDQDEQDDDANNIQPLKGGKKKNAGGVTKNVGKKATTTQRGGNKKMK